MRRIVIVGATSAIAEHCARIWTQENSAHLILIGRDVQKLERTAVDLRVRSPASTISVHKGEFLSPNGIEQLVGSIVTQARVDIVLIAHGSLPEQATCQESLKLCQEALEINGISPVLYAEAFAKYMALENHGKIVLIGSVAGDRGRKSNYVYGSAKAMVTRYAQGLQHRFAGTGVDVILVKPGPTDTPMTAHLKAQGVKLAAVNQVANQIIKAVERSSAVVYVPQKWSLIMQIIRHLPSRLFNKLDI